MNLHVIIGEDDFLVAEAARRAMKNFIVEEIDSGSATNAEAQLKEIAKARESFLSQPLFDPNKATWWRNVKFLPGADKLAENVKEALEDFARTLAEFPLPENQIFVLSGPKLLKTSIFAKALADIAEFTVFAPLKGRAAIEQAVVAAIDFAAEEGFQFDSGAAEAFIAKVGLDMRSIRSETAKLRCYLEPERKTATRADVAAIVSPGAGVEPNFWAITDAIGARNAEKAISAAMEFAGESNFAVMISGAIERFFRQLIDLERIADTLAPFQVRNLQNFRRNWNPNELRAARFRFLNLRERAVASGGEATGDLIATEIVRACKGRIKP